MPDDDAGRDFAFITCCHIANRPDAAKHMRLWLGLWTPWLQPDDRDDLIARALWQPLRFTADRLGRELGCTDAVRTRYQLWTIGAIDVPKDQRKARRRERQRDQAYRRANGAKPRARYEAESLARVKPREAEGISRRTWYRRRGTSPSAALFLSSTETRTCAKRRPSRPRPASRLPKHFASDLACSDRPVLARRSRVSALAHQQHRGWLSGKGVTVQISDDCLIAVWSSLALARGGRGSRLGVVS